MSTSPVSAKQSRSIRGGRGRWALICWLALTGIAATAQAADPARITPSFTPVQRLHNAAAGDQDDLCFWHAGGKPQSSRVFVSDKKAGHLFAYRLDGSLVQTVTIPKPGNIDIRQDIRVGGRLVDVVAVNQRTDGWRLRVLLVDRETGALKLVDGGGIPTLPNYGGCLAHDPRTEQLWWFSTSEDAGLAQYELTFSSEPPGLVSGRLVRHGRLGKCEGAVADDAAGVVFITVEEEGLFRATVQPADRGATPISTTKAASVAEATVPGIACEQLVRVGEQGLVADLEGITTATLPDGTPALIISSQGSGEFVILERRAPYQLRGRFRITGADETDGIELWQTDQLPGFPGGAFACHTGTSPHPILLAPWGAIAASVERRVALPAVEFLGSTTLAGTLRDRSGLRDALEDETPHDRLGGLGSAIAWTGTGNRYRMVPDRGPKDGAVDYHCRWHDVEIEWQSARSPQAQARVAVELVSTTVLRDAAQQPLSGQAGRAQRFDPEGARCSQKHRVVYLAEEYGPSVVAFDSDGLWQQSFPVPERFRPTVTGKTPAAELPPHNTRGRQPNRGLEGLALTPDETRLWALMQGPLLQDGALNAELQRIGRHVRLLELPVHPETGGPNAKGAAREYVYRLEDPSHGCNEIEAVTAATALVLERDGQKGDLARFKRIYAVDFQNATDVAALDALPGETLPATIQPLRKTLLLDLLDPRWGLAGPDFPEKTEGLALGPPLPDGRRLLVIVSDNDFQPDVPTRFDLFAVSIP